MERPDESADLARGAAASNFSNLMKSRTFLALVALSVLLLFAIVLGLIFTSSAFHTGLLMPGGGLLDGLIANGISVVVSTILIAPLTAYFVNLRREQQLIPVRRGFVLSIVKGIDRLAEQYIHFYNIYGLSVSAFRDASMVHTIEGAVEIMKASLGKILSEMRGADQRGNESSLTKTLQDAHLVRSMLKDLAELLFRETSSIENTLMFALPLFPVEAVNDLYEIRSILLEFRGSTQSLLAVISGEDNAIDVIRAESSALNFEALQEKALAIASRSSLPNVTQAMTHISSLIGVMPVYQQRRMSELLVGVIKDAREFDAKFRNRP